MSSIWRRALRVARSNITDIADRATSIGRGRSLEEMSDAELQAELERRRREAATSDAVEKAKARAAGSSSRPSSQSQDRSSADGGVDLFDLSPKRRKEVRQYYANLELPYGASFDEVKQSYRRLMRQYHPDKHQEDPARRQLATQLSQKLTVAYNELRMLLRDRN